MSIRSLFTLKSKTSLVVGGLLVSIAGCAPGAAPVPESMPAPVAVNQPARLAEVGHKKLCVANRGESPGQAFVRLKVHHLRADPRIGFDYKDNGYADPAGRRGYHRPTYDETLKPGSKAALAAAFEFLKPSFQQALCENLDYVFVDDNEGNFTGNGDSGMGWAFWEVTAKQTQDYPLRQPVPPTTEDQADGRGRFIAVPASLIDSRPSVQGLLRSTLEKLLGEPGNPVVVPNGLITVTPIKRTDRAQGNMKTPALAAVMLHELGHVLWFQTCVADRSTKCDGFRKVGWQTDLTWPGSGIHNPKLPLGALRTDGNQPGIDQIASAARAGDLEPLYALLGVGSSGIANSTNWVSLLSATAPDEDFAETVTILGLQRNGVQVDYHGPRGAPDIKRVARNINPTKARLAGDLLPALFGPQ